MHRNPPIFDVFIQIIRKKTYHALHSHYAGMLKARCGANRSQRPWQVAALLKGYRGYGLCSHVIACNCSNRCGHSLTATYLNALICKLCERPKKAAHRPRATAAASRKQPSGDSASDSDEEDDFEDEPLEEESE